MFRNRAEIEYGRGEAKRPRDAQINNLNLNNMNLKQARRNMHYTWTPRVKVNEAIVLWHRRRWVPIQQ